MSASHSHHLAAVWFADIVGYTALSEESESRALQLVQILTRTVREVVNGHGGRVVKFLGDGALAEFPSTEKAVRSACALVERFSQATATAGLGERNLRLGIHVGDVAQDADGDLFGDGVNVASRIQALSEAGEVWVSDDVRRQLRQRDGLAFESRGERTIKGIALPLSIHAVTVEGAGEWSPPKVEERATGRRYLPPFRARSPMALALGVIIVTALAGGAWWLGRDSTDPAGPADAAASGTTVSAPDRSIAVLPFENLSPDPNDAFFAAGVADDILSSLAQIPEMEVISRTSTAQYEGTTKSVRQIAEELGVGNVLEGSVRRAGSRIRIVVQLIDARADRHLWTETYDREMTDVFAIQSEIAERVAAALDATLSAEVSARLAAGGTKSLDAYALYLKGRDRLLSIGEDVGRTREDIRAAMQLLQAAVDYDPEYAAAWATLGSAYGQLVIIDDPGWADSANAMARKAIDLDPNVSQGYATLGLTQHLDGHAEEALSNYRRAVSLDPNDTLTLTYLGLLLWQLGRYDEALAIDLKGARIEPTRPLHYSMVAGDYTNLGLYEESESWIQRAIALDPKDGMVHAFLADLAVLRGNGEEAKRALKRARELSPMNATVLYTTLLHEARAGNFSAAREAAETMRLGVSYDLHVNLILGFIYEQVGETGKADPLYRQVEESLRRSVEKGSEDPAVYFQQAQLAVIRDDHDEAFRWLDEAYRRGLRDLVLLSLDPITKLLQDDPRYARLVSRIRTDVSEMRERVLSSEGRKS